MVSEREGSIPLAGGRRDGVKHRWRCNTDRRLAHTAPEPARRHDDGLDLRQLLDAHHIVGVEILLLDPTILDCAAPEEQPGQAIHKRTRDLSLNLSRIHRVSGISSGDDAMDPHLVAVYRNLGTAGNVASKYHRLREATVDSGRRRLAPTGLLRNRIEYSEMLRMLSHQLAPELECIHAHDLGKLIHEAFDIDGVVIDVHPAPECRADMRVAHRLVHQDVRDRIAERRLRSAGIKARESCWISAFLHSGRSHGGQN